MCGLCGVLGVEDHWSDTLGDDTETEAFQLQRKRELERRTHLANIVLKNKRLKLKRWQANGFVLASPTGRTLLVPHIAVLAAHVETLTGTACDPLDPDFLTALSKHSSENVKDDKCG